MIFYTFQLSKNNQNKTPLHVDQHFTLASRLEKSRVLTTLFFRFKSYLLTYGDKFTEKEVKDAFDAMELDDDGNIDTAALITLLTGKDDEDEA